MQFPPSITHPNKICICFYYIRSSKMNKYQCIDEMKNICMQVEGLIRTKEEIRRWLGYVKKCQPEANKLLTLTWKSE